MIYKLPLIGWLACFIRHSEHYWEEPACHSDEGCWCRICKRERW